MLQIPDMSNFNDLHGFLYGLRLSVQREVAKMEPATLEKAKDVVDRVGDWEVVPHKLSASMERDPLGGSQLGKNHTRGPIMIKSASNVGAPIWHESALSEEVGPRQ